MTSKGKRGGKVLSNSSEVLLNASKYFARLVFAVATFKPFGGFAHCFEVVASAFAMTQRDDVVWGRRSALAERYPMIGGEDMPETAWSSAYGASMIEVRKTSAPIPDFEVMWKRLFKSTPTIIFRHLQFWTSFSVDTLLSIKHFLIGFVIPYLSVFYDLFSVRFVVTMIAILANGFKPIADCGEVVIRCWLNLIAFSAALVAFDKSRSIACRTTEPPMSFAESNLEFASASFASLVYACATAAFNRAYLLVRASGVLPITNSADVLRHEVVSYWPCVRNCGQAIGLAFRLAHDFQPIPLRYFTA